MALSLKRRRALLERAAIALRPVEISYRKEGAAESEKRIIEIDEIIESGNGDPLAVAYCRLRQGIRAFRLDRIEWHRTLRTPGYEAVIS